MGILPAWRTVAYTYSTPGGQKRAFDPLGLELEIDGCELLCRCWELNLDPLEEQSVLLITKRLLFQSKKLNS